MPERILALAAGGDILVILQRCMNDPSLIRVHRLQRYRTFRSLYLVSNVLCQCLKRLFPSLAVILGIELHADVILALLVDNQADQILERIQGLTSLTDQNTHILAGEIDVHLALFLVESRCDLHI